MILASSRQRPKKFSRYPVDMTYTVFLEIFGYSVGMWFDEPLRPKTTLRALGNLNRGHYYHEQLSISGTEIRSLRQQYRCHTMAKKRASPPFDQCFRPMYLRRCPALIRSLFWKPQSALRCSALFYIRNLGIVSALVNYHLRGWESPESR